MKNSKGTMRIIIGAATAAVFVLGLFMAKVYFVAATPESPLEPVVVNLTPLAENLGVTTGVDLVTSPGPFVGTEGAVVKQGDVLVTNKGSLRGGEGGDESPIVIVDLSLPLGSNVKLLTSEYYLDLNGDSASYEPAGVNFESTLPWIVNQTGSVSVVGIGGTAGFPPGIPVDGPTLTGVFFGDEDVIDGKWGLEQPTAIDFGGQAPDEESEDNVLCFVTEDDGRILAIDFTDGVYTIVETESGLKKLSDITFVPEMDTDGELIPGTGKLYVVGRIGGQGALWVIDVAPAGPIGQEGTLIVGHVTDALTFEKNLIQKPVGLEVTALGTILIEEEKGRIFEIDIGAGEPIAVFETGLNKITGMDIGDIDGGNGEEVLITDLPTASLYAFDLGPELKITKPEAGTFVMGTITIEALATDPEGVARVNFYADIDEDGRPHPDELFQTDDMPNGDLFSAEFVTTSGPDGELSFIVEAIDYLGLRTLRSVEITIDNTPPIITDLLPPSGIFTNDPYLPISANYSDNLSGIDEASVMLILDGEDVTSGSSVTESGVIFTPTTALEDGIHTATIDVSDKAGNPASQAVTTFTVDTVAPNPPDPDKITVSLPQAGYVTVTGGAGAVEPGSTVVITNTTTGQSVTIIANADGSFSASIAASAGDSLSIVAIDRSGNVSNPATMSVTGGGFIHGTVYDAATDDPLPGARVTVKGLDAEEFSNEQGKFIFPTPDGGSFDVTIEKVGYTFVQRRAEVVRNRDTAIEPAYLTPLDPKTTLVTPAGETVSDSKGIIELEIPPGAVEGDTEIRVTAIEELKDIPGIQEDFLLFIFCGKFEPEGLALKQPATVRIENELGFEPGTELPLTVWNKETLTWDDAGTGIVTEGGRFIESTINHFSYYHFNGYIIGTGPAGGTDTSRCVGKNCLNNLGVVTSSFTPRKSSRGLTFTYNSGLAFPQVLIKSHEEALAWRGSKTRWVLSLEGVRKDVTFLNPYGKTYQAYLWDTKNGRGERVKTGSYPYSIVISDIFSGWLYYKGWIYISSPVVFKDVWRERIVVYNETYSPFGAGWTLVGLQRLHFDEDGYILLTEGNGRALVFSPTGGDSYSPPKGDYSSLVKDPEGTYTRTLKDGTRIHFTSGGLHTATVDRNGNITKYIYDSDGRLISIVDPTGKETTLSYDGGGHLSCVTDHLGRKTWFQTDENEDLIKITAPNGSSRSYTYDHRHLLISMVDERGSATQFVYDSHGKLAEKIDPTGGRHRYFPKIVKGLINDLPPDTGTLENPAPAVLYDHIFTKYVDPMGNESIAKTNEFGSIIEITNCILCGRAMQRTTLIERDENDNPTKIRRPNGVEILKTYDDRGNLISSNNMGSVTEFTYGQDFNQVTSVSDPNGNVTRIDYDPNGNPVEVIDASGNVTHMTYDSRGLLLSSTDALGNITTFSYDAKGNLISTIDALGNITTLSYDDAGNVISSTDAEGNITSYAYDEMNRLTSVTDANGNRTSYEYDPADNLTRVMDANGHATSFGYDSLGQTTEITDSLMTKKTFAYDLNGNLTLAKDRNNKNIFYEYDSVGQLVKKILPGNQKSIFEYDKLGNTIQIASPGNNLLMLYTPKDELEKEKAYISDGSDTNVMPYLIGRVEFISEIQDEYYIGPHDHSYDGKDIGLLTRICA